MLQLSVIAVIGLIVFAVLHLSQTPVDAVKKPPVKVSDLSKGQLFWLVVRAAIVASIVLGVVAAILYHIA